MTRDRAEGVLLGLACGDALGRPVEGWPADRIASEYGTLREFRGGGVHGRPPGTITDDTELALRIARSLAARGRFDPDDVADRFAGWYADGPLGIGRMTARVLDRIDRGEGWESASEAVYAASPEGRNAGNGSVMRCAPLAVAIDDPDALARASRTSSEITHPDPRCTHGCAALNLTIRGLVRGDPEPLEDAIAAVADGAPPELLSALRAVPADDPDELRVTGYVVDTLRTALHHGLTAGSAEAAVVAAVNAGGDTDTIGAVAGAVAGARHGASTLPDRWLDALPAAGDLRRLARELHDGEFGPDADGG